MGMSCTWRNIGGAIAEGEEAKALWIETALTEGHTIPEPRNDYYDSFPKRAWEWFASVKKTKVHKT